MAVVTKSIQPQPEGFITLEGGADTIIINKIEVPTWVHEGCKQIIEFNMSNIGAGVWLKGLDGSGGAPNIRMLPFGFDKALKNINVASMDSHDMFYWILQTLNDLATSTGSAVSDLAKAQGAYDASTFVPSHWHKVDGQNTIHGIKGSGAIPSGAFDFTYMFPTYTFIWNGSVWEQVAFAFNNYS